MAYDWNPKEAPKIAERRKKKDWMCRLVVAFTAIGWMTVPFVVLFLQMSLPNTNINVFMTMLGMTTRASGLNHDMMWLTLGLLLLIVTLSLTGLLFNSKRRRRKTDRYNKLNIAVGSAALVSLLGLLIAYSPALFGI
jgi:hypothetical protein